MLRWVAESGKFDRCQLGHANQLSRLADLDKVISDCAAALTSPLCSSGVDQDQDKQNGMVLTACQAVLEEPENQELRSEAMSGLLKRAKSDTSVAYIIRCLGFTTTKRFPADFDVVSACEKAFLLLSSFLKRAEECLKRGNIANVKECSMTAWKAVFHNDLEAFAKTPAFKKVADHDNILDAMQVVSGMVSDTKKLQDEAKNKGRPIQTGRPARTEDEKKLTAVKRKLKEMSRDDEDSPAQTALRKLEEEEKAKKEQKKSSKKHRKAKKRPRKGLKPYKRKSGDELRLAKKREIVARRHLLTAEYVNLSYLADSFWKHPFCRVLFWGEVGSAKWSAHQGQRWESNPTWVSRVPEPSVLSLEEGLPSVQLGANPWQSCSESLPNSKQVQDHGRGKRSCAQGPRQRVIQTSQKCGICSREAPCADFCFIVTFLFCFCISAQ